MSKKNVAARAFLCAFLICTSLFAPAEDVYAMDAASAGVIVGGMKSLAADLKRLANDAAAAGDQVLQNRIEQALTSLDVAITKLERALKNAKGEVNDLVDEAMREVTSVLSTLHDDGSTLGNYASTKLNLVMANAMSLYDNVPFLDADPSVFSLVPTRIEPAQRGRRVRVFGYLPGDPSDDIRISVNGTAVPVKRGASGSLEFALPSSLALKEEQLIAVHVEVDKHYGPFDLLWKVHRFDESVLVGKAKPFACNVISFGDNPDYLQAVSAQTSVQFDATTQGGSNRPNENRTVSAKNLFFQTMGASAAEYDAETVRIADPNAALFMYGACNGKGPHGSVGVTDMGQTLDVKLSAPSLSRSVKCHGLKCKVCDAGGTHAKAVVSPKFLAARKNAEPLKAIGIKDYAVGPAGLTVPHGLPAAGSWSMHVKCGFAEGDESWFTRTMVLNAQNKQSSARAITTRVDNGQLIIEPLNPLRLDDELK